MHLNGVAAIGGFARCVELVAHATELRAEVEPDRHTLADTHLEVTEGALRDGGASRDRADRGVAVRVLDPGRTVDAAEPHRTGARDQLHLAAGTLDRDVTHAGPQ